MHVGDIFTRHRALLSKAELQYLHLCVEITGGVGGRRLECGLGRGVVPEVIKRTTHMSVN